MNYPDTPKNGDFASYSEALSKRQTLATSNTSDTSNQETISAEQTSNSKRVKKQNRVILVGGAQPTIPIPKHKTLTLAERGQLRIRASKQIVFGIGLLLLSSQLHTLLMDAFHIIYNTYQDTLSDQVFYLIAFAFRGLNWIVPLYGIYKMIRGFVTLLKVK